MPAIRQKAEGLLWVCLAPILYSAMSISAKLASANLTVWHISVGRFGLGLLVVPVIVRMLGLSLWGQQRTLLTVRGLCGSVAFLFLVAALRRIPLSVAMVLFYLYPAFTAILSPRITDERTTGIAWLFICGAFIGTCLILWPFGASGPLNLGHLYGVISSILCALTLLLVRRLGRENNIYTLFFYLCLTGTAVGAGPLLFQEAPILPPNGVAWISLAAVAVFSIGAQLSINQALIRIPAPQVSVMMTVEIPLAAGFGIVFLGEPLSWNFAAGGILIFGCGLALNLVPRHYSK